MDGGVLAAQASAARREIARKFPQGAACAAWRLEILLKQLGPLEQDLLLDVVGVLLLHLLVDRGACRPPPAPGPPGLRARRGVAAEARGDARVVAAVELGALVAAAGPGPVRVVAVRRRREALERQVPPRVAEADPNSQLEAVAAEDLRAALDEGQPLALDRALRLELRPLERLDERLAGEDGREVEVRQREDRDGRVDARLCGFQIFNPTSMCA